MSDLEQRVREAMADGLEAMLALVESEVHTARHSSMTGKCKYCGRVLAPGPHHQMYCRFYVGPLIHKWVRTSWNETFGGLDHWCLCGGWFRQGGLAGHGDGTDTAEAVCPKADQDQRMRVWEDA